MITISAITTGITDPNALSWALGYNTDDDVTGITDNLDGANDQSLGYDVLNRLTGASSTGLYGTLSYGYDADGNRDTQGLNGTNATFTLGSSSNQLVSASGGLNASYNYDADGNLTGGGTHTYSYDDTNRLASVTTASGTDTYGYNALGQRVEKTVNGTSTVFVYNHASQVIESPLPSVVHCLT